MTADFGIYYLALTKKTKTRKYEMNRSFQKIIEPSVLVNKPLFKCLIRSLDCCLSNADFLKLLIFAWDKKGTLDNK